MAQQSRHRCSMAFSKERGGAEPVPDVMSTELYGACSRMLAYPSILIISASVLLLVKLPCISASCNTEFTEIFVNKEKPYEYNGRPTRLTCYRKLTIRKCEGTCTSEVSPSVVRFPGFKKDCKCCRETRLEERPYILPCFYGNDLVPGETISLFIKEPMDCQCSECAM